MALFLRGLRNGENYALRTLACERGASRSRRGADVKKHEWYVAHILQGRFPQEAKRLENDGYEIFSVSQLGGSEFMVIVYRIER